MINKILNGIKIIKIMLKIEKNFYSKSVMGSNHPAPQPRITVDWIPRKVVSPHTGL